MRSMKRTDRRPALLQLLTSTIANDDVATVSAASKLSDVNEIRDRAPKRFYPYQNRAMDGIGRFLKIRKK